MAELEADQEIQQIVDKFWAIVELALYEHPDNTADLQAALDEEAGEMWEKVQTIRECANEIRLLIGTAMDEGDPQVQDKDLALDDPDKLFDVMAAVRDFAGQMVHPDKHWKWRSACEKIISATRRAEELLRPLLETDVFPNRSDVFTHPTAPSHSQAPLAGSVTVVTWNVTEETWGEEDSDAFNLPDAVAGGETEARIGTHCWSCETHKNTDHPEIAVLCCIIWAT